jgi:hypothetical protein
MKSLCFVCGIGFLCDGACAIVRVNGVDVDLNIVDAMMNPGEPQTRVISRHGKEFVETVNRLGRTIYPCENNTGKYSRVDYYEYDNALGGNRIVIRQDVRCAMLDIMGDEVRFISESCEVLLNGALEFSVKPKDIVPSETYLWETALLNITDCPESILIPMCLKSYQIEYTIEGCEKFGINHERALCLAKANALSIPKGDVLVLHQNNRPSIDDTVFSVSVKQYYWAHQLLEANMDVFEKKLGRSEHI